MEGQRAPKEATKVDLANDGALVVKPSPIDVIVDPKRVRNNGKKHCWSSHQPKLRRFGSSGVGEDAEMNAYMTRSPMLFK
jgi:hypothetical protein